jgi:tRNA (guanine-N7-)-methyltransferase
VNPSPLPSPPSTAGAGASAVIALPDIITPIPVDDLFDPGKPLEVDVGCGDGRFLLAHATAHPERQFLGIERLLGRIRKVDRKIGRLGLTNVRLIRLEALYSLKYLLPPGRVSVFYIFFPDPWPKRRHHKRRLFCPDFLDLLASRLTPGGRVEIATDHLDYFAAIRKLFAADTRFREVPHTPRGEAEQTDFEQFFLRQGAPIGACAFVTV